MRDGNKTEELQIDSWKPFSTVREKADGKGHYARIMTRGFCAHNDRGIMRAL